MRKFSNRDDCGHSRGHLLRVDYVAPAGLEIALQLVHLVLLRGADRRLGKPGGGEDFTGMKVGGGSRRGSLGGGLESVSDPSS